MKKFCKAVLLLSAVTLMGTAASVQADAKTKVKVSKVTVKSNYGSRVRVAVGKKIKLKTTVKVKPNKAANKKVTYKSSNKKIATVSASGYVKGVKAGTCKIKVISKKNKKKKATIKVTVVKKVSSIKLAASTKEIYAGESVKVTPTVLPATGSYKGVTWSSSNKKVATVTSKGVVRGVAGGTVTITAKSVEGSGTKGTIKIKVLSKDTVNLTSVEVVAKDCVRISLNKMNNLNKTSFAITGKKYSFGKYNKKYTIRRIRNYDGKNYDLFLDQDTTIAADSYVKVDIASLPGNGTKTKETQAVMLNTTAPTEEYWTGETGEKVKKTIDLSEYCYGDAAYTVTGSVSGVTWKQCGNQLEFSGTYNQAGTGALVIRAVDETDRVIKQTVHVAVGDKNTIQALDLNKKMVQGTAYEDFMTFKICGGSGKYSYTASSLPEGLNLHSDGSFSGTPVREGTYKITLYAVDSSNANLKKEIPVTLTVESAKKFVGVVKDTDHHPLADIVVTVKDRKDGTIYTAVTNSYGYYSVNVPAGSYDIIAQNGNASDSVYNIVITTGTRQFEFTFDKITAQ